MAEGSKLAKYFLKPQPRVYPTGFADLDRLLDGGLREGESTIIGGFPSHAKSALGEQFAWYMSADVETLFLSLEMGEDVTRLRMGAKIAKSSLGAFRRCGLDPLTRNEFDGLKLDIYTPPVKSIEAIEKLVKRGKHKVVIIDDCRNISGVIMNNGKSDAHRIAQRITEIAEENGVHIVALQQLDTSTFRKGPNEWKFMDSSIFEQRAYNSLTLYRPFKHHGASRDLVAEIRIRKNRNGPSAKLHYRWVGETMSFWELSDEEFDDLCTCCKKRQPAAAS